jgi:hypothetical protein
MEAIIPQKRCFKCKQIKPLTDFARHRSRSDGRSADCLSCRRVYTRQWGKSRKNGTTKAMRQVGFSRKDYDNAYTQQNGTCALCGKCETSKHQSGTIKRLAVDHDHVTGKFRGLLCYSCNVKLAVLEDQAFVKAAQVYIGKA